MKLTYVLLLITQLIYGQKLFTGNDYYQVINKEKDTTYVRVSDINVAKFSLKDSSLYIKDMIKTIESLLYVNDLLFDKVNYQDKEIKFCKGILRYIYDDGSIKDKELESFRSAIIEYLKFKGRYK